MFFFTIYYHYVKGLSNKINGFENRLKYSNADLIISTEKISAIEDRLKTIEGMCYVDIFTHIVDVYFKIRPIKTL